MRKRNRLIAVFLTMAFTSAVLSSQAFAAFVSGSTGADGDFLPTTNTVLQVPDNGVFNYGMVNIPSGVTVTFNKNTQNTPVTILATGDVTINGTIAVNGSNGNNITPGAGGPGGFDGGVGGYINSAGFRGQGPGGGIANAGAGGGAGYQGAGGSGSNSSTYYGYSGNTPGRGGGAYGNGTLIPLIGGSGGAGGGGTSNFIGGAGGGGGGALLIASSGTIRVSGSISANGGNGAVYSQTNSSYPTYAGGGGSGGAIRLVANTITGEGTISAAGGGAAVNTYYSFKGGSGSSGWIRLEGWQITRSSNTTPPYTSLTYPTVLYPANLPSVAITQVNGINAPTVTFGAFRTPDITLPYNTTGPITVTVVTQNVPAGKTVTVKALPESGTNAVTAMGTLDSTGSIQVQLSISGGTAYVLTASVNY